MAEEANGAQESPEARLYAAGFTRQLEYWRAPDGSAVLALPDAIAKLDAGEIEPFRVAVPGVHPDTARNFRQSAELLDEMLDRIQNPPEPEPPPLPSWAEPWAELVADKLLEKLKPVIRAEVRAVLRAEAQKKTREPAT